MNYLVKIVGSRNRQACWDGAAAGRCGDRGTPAGGSLGGGSGMVLEVHHHVDVFGFEGVEIREGVFHRLETQMKIEAHCRS